DHLPLFEGAGLPLLRRISPGAPPVCGGFSPVLLLADEGLSPGAGGARPALPPVPGGRGVGGASGQDGDPQAVGAVRPGAGSAVRGARGGGAGTALLQGGGPLWLLSVAPASAPGAATEP